MSRQRATLEILNKYIIRKINSEYILIPLTDNPEKLLYTDKIGANILKYFKKYKSEKKTIKNLAIKYKTTEHIVKSVCNEFVENITKKHTLNNEETINNISNKIKGKTGFKPIISGSFEVTGRCNLICKHCYAIGERVKENLTFKQIKPIIDQMIKENCLFMQLTGGECTFHKEFIKIYVYMRKKGIIPSISTNGTLITEKLLNTLVKYPPQYIKISIYGSTKEIHEEITRVKGSFERMIKNVKKLKEQGLEVYFTGMVFKNNYENIDNMKKLATEMTVPIIFYSQIIPTLTNDKTPLDMSIDNDLQHKIKEKNDIIPKFSTPKISEQITEKDKNKFNCNAGTETFHMDSHGNLFICKVERTKGISAIKYGFKEAFNKLTEVSEELLSYPNQCKACGKFNNCYSCPVKVNLANTVQQPYWFCNNPKGGDIEEIL